MCFRPLWLSVTPASTPWGHVLVLPVQLSGPMECEQALQLLTEKNTLNSFTCIGLPASKSCKHMLTPNIYVTCQTLSWLCFWAKLQLRTSVARSVTYQLLTHFPYEVFSRAIPVSERNNLSCLVWVCGVVQCSQIVSLTNFNCAATANTTSRFRIQRWLTLSRHVCLNCDFCSSGILRLTAMEMNGKKERKERDRKGWICILSECKLIWFSHIYRDHMLARIERVWLPPSTVLPSSRI